MSLVSDKYKNKQVCKYCKWATTDQIGDKYCFNNRSENRAEFVSDTDSCEYFERNE